MIRTEKRTAETGGVAAEIDLHEIHGEIGLALHVPRMTKKTPKKIHLGGIKRMKQKLKRRRRKQMVKLQQKRNLHPPSHPNVNLHPSWRYQSNKKSLKFLQRRNEVIEEREETRVILEIERTSELTGLPGGNLQERMMIADVEILLENIHQEFESDHLVLGRGHPVHVNGHPVFGRGHRVFVKGRPRLVSDLPVSGKDRSLLASTLLFHVNVHLVLQRDLVAHASVLHLQDLKCVDDLHARPAPIQSLPVVHAQGADPS